jgi:hypothetical protein
MPDYVCDVYGCGRILPKPYLVALHKRTYHTPAGERVFAFTCTRAGCGFRGTDKRRDFVQHVATHTPAKERVFAFTCTWEGCGYRGTDSRGDFAKHVATHKPAVYTHPCTFSGCGYTTNYAFALTRHMKRHAFATPLPYACRFCYRRFTENFNCTAHELRHGAAGVKG